MAAHIKSTRFKSPSTSPWMLDMISSCEWFTKGDRLEVCRLLYNNNLAKQKHGLDRLAAWRARIHPRVPLGFEVTSSLIIALMAVTKPSLDGGEMDSVTDSETARLNLAMAIVRFVNLVTETGQVMHFVLDVSSIASRMGVPEWIVDIRHNCSHSMLPSLQVLISAARFALKWTKTHFWEADDPLDVHGTFVLNTKSVKLVTRADVVRRLANAQLVLLQSDQQRRGHRNVIFAKKDLEYLRKIEIDELMDILIEDGLLNPSHDKAFSEFFVDMDGGEDGQSMIINKRLRDYWMPIFEDLLLQRPDALQSVISTLIFAATQHSEVRRSRLAFEWTITIFERFVTAKYCSRNVGLEAIREALKLVARDINGNSLRLLNKMQQMSVTHKKPEKMKKTEPSHRLDVVDDCGVWKLCSGKEWSTFAIGIDKDEAPASWFADKLQLKCPRSDVANVNSPRNLKRKFL